MMLTEQSQVVLKKPLPRIDLEPGDAVMVVHVHSNGAAYEVEFLTMSGATIAAEANLAPALRPASGCAIVRERELAAI